MKRNADPIDPALAEVMQVLAAFIDQAYNGPPSSPREVGFVLLSFRLDAGDGQGRTNYISNAELADVVAMLREFIRHAEARLKADQRDRAN